MLGKNEILEVILKECDICLHLYDKIPEGGMDYRPSEGQRSTHELLQYLSFCAIAGTRTMAEGNWDAYQALAKASHDLAAEDFPAAMEKQKADLRAYFDTLTQEQVETQTAETPTGETMTLERGLVELPMKWMIAYRMQLFLYAKQAGNDEIWTPNCWAGIDWEKPAPTETTSS